MGLEGYGQAGSWGLYCFPPICFSPHHLQEDAIAGPLGDSTEDISLDLGALQGSQYLQDLGLEAPAHSQTGAARDSDPPSGAAGNGSSSSSSAGPQGRPRRCSWARPRSCSDRWQRLVPATEPSVTPPRIRDVRPAKAGPFQDAHACTHTNPSTRENCVQATNDTVHTRCRQVRFQVCTLAHAH